MEQGEQEHPDTSKILLGCSVMTMIQHLETEHLEEWNFDIQSIQIWETDRN